MSALKRKACSRDRNPVQRDKNKPRFYRNKSEVLDQYHKDPKALRIQRMNSRIERSENMKRKWDMLVLNLRG